MTQENKETPEQEFLNVEIKADEIASFDVREMQEYEGEFPLRIVFPIRPMIQFMPGKQDTTEARLEEVREQMTYTRARNTIRRSGWYFTEPYAPNGECTTENVIQSIRDIFGA